MAMGQGLGAVRIHQGGDGRVPASLEVGRPHCGAASSEEGNRGEVQPEQVSLRSAVEAGE